MDTSNSDSIPAYWAMHAPKGSYSVNSVASMVLSEQAFFHVFHAWDVFNATNLILPGQENWAVWDAIADKQNISELTPEELIVFRNTYELGYLMGGSGLQKFVNSVAAIIWVGDPAGIYFIKSPDECLHHNLMRLLHTMYRLALWLENETLDQDPLVACARYLERHKYLSELCQQFSNFVTKQNRP